MGESWRTSQNVCVYMYMLICFGGAILKAVNKPMLEKTKTIIRFMSVQ